MTLMELKDKLIKEKLAEIEHLDKKSAYIDGVLDFYNELKKGVVNVEVAKNPSV